MRVLLSAYACAPGRGSEAGVGWGWATALAAAGHETHVLTRAQRRAEIERDTAQTPRPGLHFHYYALPPWLNALLRRAGGAGVRLHYCLWQIMARRRVREILATARFDAAHHVAFAQFWSPCALTAAAESGTPFIWGPVGGGEIEPAAFWPGMGPRAAAWEMARWLLHHVSPWLPWARRAAALCRVAVATTPETAERLARLGAQRIIIRSQVALEPERLALLTLLAAATRRETPPRLVYLGDLAPLKGVRLALDAVARLPGDWAFDIIGDGPDRAWLERRATRLGIADRTVFHGRLPQNEAWRRMAAGSALLLPALHDSGGFAVAEAMAAGLSPVCLALGGPGLMAEAGGVAVSAPDPATATDGLVRALRRLIEEPEYCAALGRQAQDAARTRFSWAASIAAVYAAAGLTTTATAAATDQAGETP